MCWVFSISLVTAFSDLELPTKPAKPTFETTNRLTVCLTICVNVQFTDLLIKVRDFAGAQATLAIVQQHLVIQSFVHLTSNKPNSEKGKLYRNAPLQQSLFQIPLPPTSVFSLHSTRNSSRLSAPALEQENGLEDLALFFYFSVSNCDIQVLLQTLHPAFLRWQHLTLISQVLFTASLNSCSSELRTT